MKKVKRKVLLLGLAATMLVSFTGCGNNNTTTPSSEGTAASSESTTAAPESTTAAPDSAGLYTAGTYTATAKGHNGDLTLAVTFDESAIKSIEVKEHNETPGISDTPIDKIPEQIIANQSLKVDVVSGATFTSNAILTAVADAVTQAGGDAEALKNVALAEKESSKEPVVKEADVIVVGAGNAGLASAVSAAEEGASVIVVEKNSYVGGNTIRAGGGYACADPDAISAHTMTEGQMQELEALIVKETDNEIVKGWQKKVAEDIEAYKAANSTYVYDSVEFTALQFYFRFSQAAEPELLYDLIKKSKPAKDWLAEIGFPWNEKPNLLLGDSWPRWFTSSAHKNGQGFILTFLDAIEENNYNVEIIKEVRANELLLDGGRVVGVKGTSADGTEYTLNAGKGVILATGGFSANPEMLVEYTDGRWGDVSKLVTTNDPAMVGDGIKMALEAGADVTDMAHLQVLPISAPAGSSTGGFIGSATNMYVNKEGKRFVNELADRDTLSKAILAQPDAVLFIVSDADNSGVDENGLNGSGQPVQDLIDAGIIVKGDTLEELAEKMGVDPVTFVETVEKFNEAVLTGNDPEFKRQSFAGDFTNPDGTPGVFKAPFYAGARTPAAHITKGGIKVNVDAEVISKDGEVIPGLFAAGEVTGGRSVAGLLEATTSGLTAGKTVMGKRFTVE